MSIINENYINHPILKYPLRSPLYVASYLQNIIKDKIICDVGCACGDLLVEFAKYSKNVLGVEHDEERANIARARGFNVTDTTVPYADVYYIWANAEGLIDIMEKLKGRKGIFILAEESRNPELGGYEIAIPLVEADELRTEWKLQIVRM